jgi:hypothetical protein
VKPAPAADPRRAALDAELLGWMRESRWERDDERFERLALGSFRFQFEHCPPYRRFCQGRGVTPSSARSWRELPCVPTGAFKELVLCSFPPQRTRHRFLTSGTSTAQRGALHLDTLELYEASLLPTFRRHVLPDLAPGARARICVLAPSRGEQPESSLSHMFDVVLAELGDAQSGHFVSGDRLDVEALLARIDSTPADRPLVLCGTAFAFVHLLDDAERRGRSFHLPGSARIMETGGFKGRSRELSRAELHGLLELRLGVPPERVVNQYGMTELGSQFYDSVLARPGEPRRKLGPPWARVAIVDPRSGKPAAPGEAGVITVVDLANSGSVCALQTADLGRARGDGFEVLGREPGAEERGCSIATDLLLSDGQA